ncbi:MAG TPA: LPS export ABC transporter ATP-binding protein [Burkholderiales bacterium]|nr:LPS export ABC transporter ATP-binding protein [Burkholderiales bacterium]
MATFEVAERISPLESLANAVQPVSELRAQNLKKRYRSRVVVKDVSLHVRSGEVIGLLGPNGAGKTTCFYMMVGLVAMDGGELELDAERLTHMPIHARARRGLSYLPQEASIFRRLSVADNVRAVLELHSSDRSSIELKLDDLLRELHVSHLRDNPAISLSGGERRRVEIARALASQPAFMLLDEPFAGIDPLAIADIREVIEYLKKRGIGILITDHNVRETLDIIDRASIIHAGEVLFEGAPDEIVDDPEVRRVYLGDRFT